MAFTHITSYVVETGPMITTEIVKTFIDIYKGEENQVESQLEHQPEHNNVIAAQDWQ